MTSTTTITTHNQMHPLDNYYDSGSSVMSAGHSDYYSMHYEYEMELREEESKPDRVKRKYRTRPKSPNTVKESKVRRRKRANSRERKRMQMLNDALETLRQSLPQATATQSSDEQKMTKIETLKSALDYIHDLSEILRQSCSADSSAHSSPSFHNHV